MLRKISVVAALVIGVVALRYINAEFRPRIDPDLAKRQSEELKEIKEAAELKREAAKQRKEDAERRANEETVDVSHILIMASGDEAAWAKAKTKIDEARKRVTGGEDFGKVARDVSEDPAVKGNGGAYPNTPPGMMVPEFEKVMFETPVGQISEPFRTSYGWHILKVTGRHGKKADGADAKKDEDRFPDVPAVYKVKFETTKGDFVLECHKDWAPIGAARFYDLIQKKYYEDSKLFRVAKGFVVQWGIAGDPPLSKLWIDKKLPDEPVKQSNTLGTISFAKGGPNTRTTQVFINLDDNSAKLDGLGFSVFGKVVEGMDVINALNGKYGEAPAKEQEQIHMRGNKFLDEQFPGLDGIKTATIVP